MLQGNECLYKRLEKLREGKKREDEQPSSNYIVGIMK
jgi:hypothetical protein